MAWLVLIPLGWSCIAFLLGPARGGLLALIGLLAQLLVVVQVTGLHRPLASSELAHTVGGWDAPLGIVLAVDGLSAVMLLLTQLIALPLAVYARSYLRGEAALHYFWPLVGLLLCGLNALLLTTDIFNMYVGLELVGLAAVGLVAGGGSEKQLLAALRYLFATLLGSGAFLLGVALIYGTYGTVALDNLLPLVGPDAPATVPLAGLLMLAGLMLKTALFPFHYWLPGAHGSAPAPASALLSALVVKASFYLILRLWTDLFGPLANSIALVPILLGSAAVIWGSWQAIRAERLKRLIAYSTVAQLGYLFLVLPLLRAEHGLEAGTLQIWAHGFAKAAMFAAAGIVLKATGEDKVGSIARCAPHMPLTMAAFALAGMTLTGLPPSAGFLAKWRLVESALALDLWGVAAIMLVGSLLAMVYVFRLLKPVFSRPVEPHSLAAVPRMLEWVALLLAATSVLLGLRAVELIELLNTGAPT